MTTVMEGVTSNSNNANGRRDGNVLATTAIDGVMAMAMGGATVMAMEDAAATAMDGTTAT